MGVFRAAHPPAVETCLTWLSRTLWKTAPVQSQPAADWIDKWVAAITDEHLAWCTEEGAAIERCEVDAEAPGRREVTGGLFISTRGTGPISPVRTSPLRPRLSSFATVRMVAKDLIEPPLFAVAAALRELWPFARSTRLRSRGAHAAHAAESRCGHTLASARIAGSPSRPRCGAVN
jgi:hypothetical protein